MSLCDASGEDASGPQIAGSVVAFVKGVDLHTAGGAGVDELTAAQIDAHVLMPPKVSKNTRSPACRSSEETEVAV